MPKKFQKEEFIEIEYSEEEEELESSIEDVQENFQIV